MFFEGRSVIQWPGSVRVGAWRAAALLLGMGFCASAVAAGPGNGQVVAGQGDITHPNQTTTLINQQSNRLIIDWSSFNVPAGSTVQFNQPSVSAAALNRIFSQTPSQIFGSIIANGQVYLLNPNGIVFSKSASVNVGGLFATGLNISNSDFMSGKLDFTAAPGETGGAVVNHGLLRAADGGSINLIGGSVFNDGLIVANLGQVNLAAGSAVTVDFDGDGLMRFAVSASDLHKMVDAQSGAAVTNAGRIVANGGSVVMTGAVAEQVVMQAVNNTGLVQAQGVQNHNGHIYLTGSGGDVTSSGVLDASNASGSGGGVQLSSDQDVSVTGSVNASGTLGGGSIRVGSSQIGSNSEVTAQTVTLGTQALLNTDATQSGDGGSIAVRANQLVAVNGSLSAHGGTWSGNGGLIETSAEHVSVGDGTRISTIAPYGRSGDWLIDPNDFNIAPSGGNITGAALSSNLAGGNITILSSNGTTAGTGSINVNDAVSWSANTLTLTAADNVNINQTMSASGTAGLILNPATANGSDGAVPGGASIIGSGGNLTLSGTGTMTLNAGLTDNGVFDISGVSSGLTITSLSGVNTGTVKLGSNTLTLGNAAGTFGGIISGAGRLILGGGTEILTGANTYSGGTTISAGTLQIGNGGATGSAGSGNVTDDGALIFNLSGSPTVSSLISGTGTVTQMGTGVLTLSGNNTFSGGLTIDSGTVSGTTNARAFGAGTITLGNSSGSANATLNGGYAGPFANLITVAAGSSGTLSVTNTAASTFSGAITLNNNLTLTPTATNTLTLSGGITGTGNLIVSGTGTSSAVTLSGSPVNNSGSFTNQGTNTGATTISGGVGSNVTGITENSATSALTISGGVVVNSGGTTLTNNSTSGTKLLTVSGGVSGTGNLILNNNSATAAGITLSGTGVNNAGAITNSGSGSGSTLISAGLGAAVTGVEQNSASSSLTLNGANTNYAGVTSLTLGTMKLGSATALGGAGSATGTGGALNIAAGTTLDASATTTLTTVNTENWNGNLTFGGSFALNLGSGAIVLGAPSIQVSNSGSGLLTVGGGVTGASALTLNANAAGGFTFASANVNNAGTITNSGTGAGAVTISKGVGSNVTGITENSATSALTISGGLVVNSGGTILTNNNASGTKLLTVSGGVIGTGNLILNNNSAIASGITLSITAVNNIGTITNSGTGTGTAIITSGVGSNVTGIIQSSSTSGFADSGTLTVNSSGTTITSSGMAATTVSGAVSGTGNLTLNANNTGTITVGAGAVGNIGILTNSGSGSGLVTIGGVIGASVTGVTENSASSELVLTKANAYTGSTNVNAGTLKAGIANAVGSGSALTVASGAFFDLGGYSDAIGSLAGAGTVTSSAAGAVTLTAGANNTSSIFSGGIQNGSGTVALTKNGTGTLTLSGASAYTGLTTISAGTLQVGNGGATGSLGNGNITDNAALIFNLSTSPTVPNLISGTGALTQAGTGTTALTKANSYTGSTNINAGTLKAGIANAVGSGSALTVASGAFFDLGGYSDAIGSLAGAGTVTSSAAGAVTLTAGANNTSSIFSGGIQNGSGTVALTKNGTGTLTLSGANAYIGVTNVNAGTLSVANAGAINASAGAVTVASGAALNINGVMLNSVVGGLLVRGTGVAGTGAFTGTGVSGYAGPVTLAAATTMGSTGILTLAAVNGGENSLALVGAGTDAFTGTVTAGTLNLNNAAGGNVTFSNNVTIGAGGISTLANDFNVAFNGNNNSISGLATFSNTGAGSAVTLVSSGGTSTFTDGVNTASGPAMTFMGGTLATTGAPVNLGVTTLTANTTLNSGAGDITFNNTLDGGFALTAISSGTTTFGGIVGGTTPLGGITTDSAGTTMLDGDVSTTGAQVYNDAVILGGSVKLNSGSNAVTFSSTLDNATSTARTLTVIAGSGAVAFGGIVGGGVNGALAGLTTNSGSFNAEAMNIGGSGLSVTTTATGIGQSGAFSVSGASSFNAGSNPIMLSNIGNKFAGVVYLNTSGAGANVVLNNSVATNLGLGTVGGGLQVVATGSTPVGTAIGQSGILTVSDTSSFNSSSGNGAINLSSANLLTGAVSFTSGSGSVALTNNRPTVLGASTIGGTLGVTSNGAITQLSGTALTVGSIGQTTFSSGAAPITLINSGNSFAGPVSLATGGSNQDASIDASSGTLTLAAPGGLSLSGNLDVADPNGIVLGSNITSGGGQAFNGPVALSAAVTLDSSAGNGNIDFNPASTLDSQGATAQPLIINAGVGNVTFGAEVGGISPLASLSVTGNTFLLGGSVTTIGSQIYAGNVNLGGNTTLITGGAAGANIQFQSQVSGSSNNLVLNAGANGAISETGAGSINGTGSVTLTGGTITMNGAANSLGSLVLANGSVNNSNVQIFNQNNLTLGAVSLRGGNVTITTAAGLTVSGLLSDTSGNGSAALTLDVDSSNAGANADFSALANTSITGFGIGKISVNGSSSASDTLLGPDDIESWMLTGSNTGNLDSGIIAFSNFKNLTGGTADDTFDLATGSLAGNIQGGSGTNRLIAGNSANSWTIIGADSGTVTNVGGSFTGIQNLTGGTADDTFTFSNGATLSGAVDGGAGGVNTLDFTAYTNAVGVSLTGSNVYGRSGMTAGSPNPLGSGFSEITAINLPAQANTLNLGNVSSTVLINSSAATNLFNLTVEQGTPVTALTFTNVGTVNGGTGVTNTLQSNEATNNTWTLTGANAGSYNDGQILAFTNFADLNGGSGNDRFVFTTGGLLAGTVDGGTGAGTNTLDYSGVTSSVAVNLLNASASSINGGAVSGFSNIQALTGNGPSTTLTGPTGTNTWQITGADQGNINGGFTFGSVNNLIGSGADTFAFMSAGVSEDRISGSASGATLDWSNDPVVLNVSLSGVGSSNGVQGNEVGSVNSFDNVVALIGSSGSGASNSITGPSAATGWAISGVNIGTVTVASRSAAYNGFGTLVGAGSANTLTGDNSGDTFTLNAAGGGTAKIGNGATLAATFTGMHDLVGGSGNDSFVFVTGGSLAGSLDGEGGTNTLTGDSGGDTFSVNAANSGSLALTGGATLVTSFSNIENLAGGSGNDWFAIETAGSLSGTVDGEGGSNTLDYSGNTASVTVNLGSHSASAINGGLANGISNIQALTGNGANTTLTGLSGTHSWDITGADEGSIDTNLLTFTATNHLVGGGTDTFAFTSASAQEDSIIGSTSGATLDWSSYPGAVSVSLTGAGSIGLNGSASGVTSFANIIIVTGNGVNAATSSLTGPNAATNWAVSGINAGSVTTGGQTATYSNFGLLNGTGAANTLTGDATGDLFTLSAADGGSVDINNGANLAATFSGMQNLTGGSGNDTFNLNTGSLTGSINGGGGSNTLVAGNGANSWAITGANTGTVTNIAGTFTNIGSLTGGTGADTFTFNNGASVAGVVDGGAGGVNTLDFSAYTTAVGVSLTTSGTHGSSGTTSAVSPDPNPIGSGFAEITAIDLPAAANTLNLNPVSSTVLINSSAATNLFNLTVEQSGVPNLTFGNVSSVNGGTGVGVTNTLQSNEAPATISTWTLTGANGGTYQDSQSLAFTSFADLVGGTSHTNNFLLNGGSVASVAGGSGTNTLTGDDNGDTFTVSSANGGSLALSSGPTLVTSFNGIQNLAGGSGNDTFAFTGSGALTGNLDGGGGTNTLNYSGYGSSVTFDVADASGGTTGIGGTWSGVNTVIGSSGSDTIAGKNQTYTLTGVNAGNNGTVSWTSFEQIADSGTGTLVTSGGQTYNLSGSNAGTVAVLLPGGFTGIGNLSDAAGAVNFGSAGSVSGNITAQTFDYNGYATPVTFDVSDSSNATSGIGGTWTGVSTVIGSTNNDTITGSGLSYMLTGANAGSSGTVSWTSFENLTDTTGTVNFGSVGSGSGNITARALDYSGYTTPVTFDVSDRGNATTGIGGTWTDVSTVTGSTNSDTITGSGLGYTLTGVNAGSSGTVSWTSFENLADAAGTVNFDTSGSVTGNVTAQTLDYGALSTPVSVALTSISSGVGTGSATAIGGTFSGVSIVKGGSSASNQLTGPNLTNTWAMTGANTGTVDSLQFDGFGSLMGGTGTDTFTFSNGATESGTVDGGAGGTNTLNLTAYSTAVGVTLGGTNAYGYSGTTSGSPNPTGGFAEITAIDLPTQVNTLSLNNFTSTVLINSSAATNLFNLTVEQGTPVTALTFTNVGTVNGGTGVTNTLQSNEATNNTWTLTGANAGSYNDGQILAFTNFADLNGGSATSNNFILGGGSVGSLVGGSGNNTLTGDNADDTFNITAANSGSLASGAAVLVGGYTGIRNLMGGSGNDTFAFNAGGSVSGTVNGGTGNNALDYSGLNVSISTTLAAVSGGVGSGSATGIGGGFANINVLKGSNNTGNLLTGPNQANTWNLTVADGGTVDGLQFTNIGNMAGGDASNAFVLDGGSLSGDLNGGSGAVAGNSLQGNNGTNAWNITGTNQGSVTGLGGTFSNIGSLVGGSGADNFVFANNASLSGSLNGGGVSAGEDLIDWSAYTAARNVVITGLGSVDGVRGSEASIVGGFDNITNIVGANSAAGLLNTLTGPNNNNAWNVIASNAGNLDAALSFGDFQTLTGGNGTDTFNLAAGVSGSINGGGGGDAANIVSSFGAPAAVLSINNVRTVADNADATVTAGTLYISGASSIGSASHPLLTNINALQIGASGGSAFISTGNVDLQGINLGNGTLVLNSSGSVTDLTGQSVMAGAVSLGAASGIGTAAAPLRTVIGALDAAVIGAGDIHVQNAGAISLGAVSASNGDIQVTSSGAMVAGGVVTAGGSGGVSLLTTSGDLTVSGGMTAAGNVNLNAADALNLDSALGSSAGNLILIGGEGVTGNSAGVLAGNTVNITATTGDINFVGGSSRAVNGTLLAAPGNITLSGFATTAGGLTISNGGTFAVTGPVSLSGALEQSGIGPVVLDSSINSNDGNVEFASALTVGTGSVSTGGGDIKFAQTIAGSGSTSSLSLGSGVGTIGLASVGGLDTLTLQTSGVLLLGSGIAVNHLAAGGVTGAVMIAAPSVSVAVANGNVDFSSADGINGTSAGGESLAINSGLNNVLLPAVGQSTPLAGLSVDGGTIQIADVITTGAQAYAGNVQLAGNLSSTENGGVTINGNLALQSAATIQAAGGGAISVSGTVNGAQALALSTPSGNIVLGAAVGGDTPLSSLTLESARAGLGVVTTSGTQDYQVGQTQFAGRLESLAGAIDFGGRLNVAGSSAIQADTIGFEGGASSLQGSASLALLPETQGYTVSLGTGTGLLLNNSAMDGYDGPLYIGTAPGVGLPEVIQVPLAAGNINVNGSLTLGSNGTLTLAGMGDLVINAGTLSAGTVTLIAGSQNSTLRNPAALASEINSNQVILVSGAQIGQLGQELNIHTTGSIPQVQIATGAVQSYLVPPTLPTVIGPAAIVANAIAAQLGLFIQANSQVTSIGQQIAALAQTGGLLESGFVDVSLFQNISLYNISGPGITLPFDQCQQPNQQLCNQ